MSASFTEDKNRKGSITQIHNSNKINKFENYETI